MIDAWHTAGVDEAGCGPLAGPVVVAAVILNPRRRVDGLADSKVLAPARRDELDLRIRATALAFAIVEIDAATIDSINIYQARMHGMRMALDGLSRAPRRALIDGDRIPRMLRCPARAVVDGDARIGAISAASILAKVYRDRIMCAFDALHPGYGFAAHKGYSTPEHLASLRSLGPCSIHRRSFAPVAALLRPATAG
jgi:ribonuclease HII